MKKLLCLLLCMPFVILSFTESDAATVGFADEVVNYSFAYIDGITAPYGGSYTLPYTSTNIGEVEWDAALGDDPGSDNIYDFLSIWTNSYVIFGFTDETIIDGPGDDIIIRESGPVLRISEGDLGERAQISVSSDNSTWYILGIANSITDDLDVRWLDLSFDIGVDIDGNDTGLSYVSFVKVEGLDLEGAAPGFDLLNIEVLPDSMELTAPIPGAVWLLGSGLFGLAVLRRKRIK